MIDDEDDGGLDGSIARHPSNYRQRRQGPPAPPALAVVPNDSHSWGQDPRPAPGQPATRPLTAWQLVALAELAGGLVAAVWVDWRWLPTAAALSLICAALDGRRPR